MRHHWNATVSHLVRRGLSPNVSTVPTGVAPFEARHPDTGRAGLRRSRVPPHDTSADHARRPERVKGARCARGSRPRLRRPLTRSVRPSGAPRRSRAAGCCVRGVKVEEIDREHSAALQQHQRANRRTNAHFARTVTVPRHRTRPRTLGHNRAPPNRYAAASTSDPISTSGNEASSGAGVSSSGNASSNRAR